MLRAMWHIASHRRLGKPSNFPLFVRCWLTDHQRDEYDFATECLETWHPETQLCNLPISWHALPSLTQSVITSSGWPQGNEYWRSSIAVAGCRSKFHPEMWRFDSASDSRLIEWKALRNLGFGVWNSRRLLEELSLWPIPLLLQPREDAICQRSEVWERLHKAGLELEQQS